MNKAPSISSSLTSVWVQVPKRARVEEQKNYLKKNHRRKVPTFDEDYKILIQEFSGGSAGYGSRVVTTVRLVTAVVWVQSLARDLPHAMKLKKKSRIQTAQASQPEESMKKTTSGHMVLNRWAFRDGPFLSWDTGNFHLETFSSASQGTLTSQLQSPLMARMFRGYSPSSFPSLLWKPLCIVGPVLTEEGLSFSLIHEKQKEVRQNWGRQDLSPGHDTAVGEFSAHDAATPSAGTGEAQGIDFAASSKA